MFGYSKRKNSDTLGAGLVFPGCELVQLWSATPHSMVYRKISFIARYESMWGPIAKKWRVMTVTVYSISLQKKICWKKCCLQICFYSGGMYYVYGYFPSKVFPKENMMCPSVMTVIQLNCVFYPKFFEKKICPSAPARLPPRLGHNFHCRSYLPLLLPAAPNLTPPQRRQQQRQRRQQQQSNNNDKEDNNNKEDNNCEDNNLCYCRSYLNPPPPALPPTPPQQRQQQRQRRQQRRQQQGRQQMPPT